MLAYYAHKFGWIPLYPSLSQMPAEVGQAFFLCLAYEQNEEEGERLMEIARANAERLRVT